MNVTQHPGEPKFVVVIGASAGGLTALEELASQLTPGMKASFLVVLHLSRKGIGDFLVHKLQKRTSLHCTIPKNGDPLLEDHIYIAPPDHHLLVKKGSIIIGLGPEENRWRPSIDVLFRSAAAAYNGHTIGIVLTGMLDDGTAGMQAIKKTGGTGIVQDPNEAEYPDMPLSVMNNMEIDYCLSLAEMGAVLQKITGDAEVITTSIPPEIKAESEIAEKVATGIENVAALGDKSLYACPDCGGGLWHIQENAISRYRCPHWPFLFRNRSHQQAGRSAGEHALGSIAHDGRAQKAAEKNGIRFPDKRICKNCRKPRGHGSKPAGAY